MGHSFVRFDAELEPVAGLGRHPGHSSDGGQAIVGEINLHGRKLPRIVRQHIPFLQIDRVEPSLPIGVTEAGRPHENHALTTGRGPI